MTTDLVWSGLEECPPLEFYHLLTWNNSHDIFLLISTLHSVTQFYLLYFFNFNINYQDHLSLKTTTYIWIFFFSLPEEKIKSHFNSTKKKKKNTQVCCSDVFPSQTCLLADSDGVVFFPGRLKNQCVRNQRVCLFLFSCRRKYSSGQIAEWELMYLFMVRFWHEHRHSLDW